MANPLTYVSPDFWDTVRRFDQLVGELGQPIRPLLPQFELVKEIDTDELRRVANDVWGEDRAPGSLRYNLFDAADELNRVKSTVQASWQGTASLAFTDHLDLVIGGLDRLDQPAHEVARSLVELADTCEESIADVISTLAGIGGLLSAIGGFLVALLAAPEPFVTKVLGIIVGIIGLIVAAVAYFAANLKAIEERQQAADAVINDCEALVKALRDK